MNLNISLQETSIQKNYEGILFTFENFEEAYVDATYIENLDLYSSNYGNDYDSVVVIFSKLFTHDKKEIFNRIRNKIDIVYIDIYCKDESKNMEIMVPYEENDKGFNSLQNIDCFENGQAFLEISKDGRLIG